MKLTKEENEFLYYQLLARKDYFTEDMCYWVERKDAREVQRCFTAISKIDAILKKLLEG